MANNTDPYNPNIDDLPEESIKEYLEASRMKPFNPFSASYNEMEKNNDFWCTKCQKVCTGVDCNCTSDLNVEDKSVY